MAASRAVNAYVPKAQASPSNPSPVTAGWTETSGGLINQGLSAVYQTADAVAGNVFHWGDDTARWFFRTTEAPARAALEHVNHELQQGTQALNDIDEAAGNFGDLPDEPGRSYGSRVGGMFTGMGNSLRKTVNAGMELVKNPVGSLHNLAAFARNAVVNPGSTLKQMSEDVLEKSETSEGRGEIFGDLLQIPLGKKAFDALKKTVLRKLAKTPPGKSALPADTSGTPITPGTGSGPIIKPGPQSPVSGPPGARPAITPGTGSGPIIKPGPQPDVAGTSSGSKITSGTPAEAAGDLLKTDAISDVSTSGRPGGLTHAGQSGSANGPSPPRSGNVGKTPDAVGNTAPDTLSTTGPKESIVAPNTSGPAPKGTKGVAIVGPNGKLGEFDEILPGRFIEDKAGATDGITKGLKFSGKTFDEAAKDWAIKNIFQKTKVRIENLAKATRTIAEEGGSRVVPHLDDIKGIRELHFRIDGNDPRLIKHVNDQIENLRKQFSDWKFTVEFGG